MPLPAIWGPKAWKLLHAIGSRTNPKLPIDEKREITWLINHLEYIIPCPECRNHIIEYRKKNIFNDPSNTGAWIWTFHEAVNERLGKGEGPPFTYSLGRDSNPLNCWKEYQEVIKDSFLNGNLIGKDVKEWGRHLRLWLACF